MIFICYPKCTTCRRAQAFLDGMGIDYEIRDIKENNPTYNELKAWHATSDLPIKKLFIGHDEGSRHDDYTTAIERGRPNGHRGQIGRASCRERV